MADLRSVYPTVYIHSIRIEPNDLYSSFYGDANEQVAQVCRNLRRDPQLAQGFNGIGLSQVSRRESDYNRAVLNETNPLMIIGQLLRAYVQRCNEPPCLTLITLGSQHQGIAAWPGCHQQGSHDLRHPPVLLNLQPFLRNCGRFKQWATKRVYSDRIQSRFLPAQYFKDPTRRAEYLRHSRFLADINNERSTSRQPAYAHRLGSLVRLVLYAFANDTLLLPPQTAVILLWVNVISTLGSGMAAW